MRKVPNSEQSELRLQRIAQQFVYPPTPDIASAARRRLVAGSPPVWLRRRLLVGLALAVLLLLASLLAVPELRAAALRFWQIGVVRVRVEPAPAAPSALPAPLSLGLAGSTTLEAAAGQVDFPIRLPTYPSDLGPPDQVFLQDLSGDALVLVWLEPDNRAQVRMSLHILTSRVMVEKTLYDTERTQLLGETQVNGAPALWVSGPHMLTIIGSSGDEIRLRRLVAGNTLIWTQDDLTYRLESKLDLEEALRVAESLQ